MYKGKLVELTAISLDNLDLYTRWFQDLEFVRNMQPAAVVPVTRDAEKAMLEQMAKPSDKDVHFAIVTLTEGQLIGNCSLKGMDHKNRSAELGIGIGDRSFWGKGYGTDAVRTLVRFGFGELNLHRIFLKVHAYNERALKAYRNAGFIEEGRLRDGIYRDGRYWDVVVMSILRSEFDFNAP